MARNFMQPHKRMEARWRLEAEIRSKAMWGQRLVGERELAARLGIGRNTVRAAMAELEMSGMIERRVGSGTFVTCCGWDIGALLSPIATTRRKTILKRSPAGGRRPGVHAQEPGGSVRPDLHRQRSLTA